MDTYTIPYTIFIEQNKKHNNTCCVFFLYTYIRIILKDFCFRYFIFVQRKSRDDQFFRDEKKTLSYFHQTR